MVHARIMENPFIWVFDKPVLKLTVAKVPSNYMEKLLEKSDLVHKHPKKDLNASMTKIGHRISKTNGKIEIATLVVVDLFSLQSLYGAIHKGCPHIFPSSSSPLSLSVWFCSTTPSPCTCGHRPLSVRTLG